MRTIFSFSILQSWSKSRQMHIDHHCFSPHTETPLCLLGQESQGQDNEPHIFHVNLKKQQGDLFKREFELSPAV